MDQNIPTFEIVTPLTKKKVVLKKYITGFDGEAIQEIYLQGSNKITTDSAQGDGASANFDGTVIARAEREGLKRVVVSVDGQSEEVEKLVLGLPLLDAKFVAAEVQKIVTPLAEEPEKASTSSPSAAKKDQ